jgi:uncharacterized protein
MPWKNGAGVTLEIARDPPVPAEFDWRLSLATISASGPFSSYPGYRRSVSLIEGVGFRLNVEGEVRMQLTVSGESALFPGGSSAWCELIDGPSSDLSLMVREPGAISSVTLETCDIVRSFTAPKGAMQAFFCLDDALAFTLEDHIVPLAAQDTIVLRANGAPCDFNTFRPGARLMRLVWQSIQSARQ